MGSYHNSFAKVSKTRENIRHILVDFLKKVPNVKVTLPRASQSYCADNSPFFLYSSILPSISSTSCQILFLFRNPFRSFQLDFNLQ